MGFNSTVVGVPYTRTKRIVIDYPEAMTAHVTFVDQESVMLADGSSVPIGEERVGTFSVFAGDMATEVPLVSPDTGELLGASVTNSQIMLSILAAIRAHQ